MTGRPGELKALGRGRRHAGFPSGMRAHLPQRDPTAMARLIDVHGPRAYEYLRGLTQDEHIAEDLTQDVFLRVHRALPGYDPECDPGPWILAIARNRLRDYWRSSREPARVDPKEEVELERWHDPRQAPPESLAYEGELAVLVRAAIDALPARTRITVSLRVYEGLPFDKIAEVVNREEGAVRKRYSRALATLKGALREVWRAHVQEAT